MTLEKTLRWVVLGGIFVLPFIVFIVAQSLFFPFITGKNFAFRIIVEVITGAWIALALVYPAYRPRRSWLLAAFALFVIIIALADALGVNPFKSFWSNFERMDGWITLVHLLLYFVVTSTMLSAEKLWRTFWHVSLGISVVIGVYALLQLFGIASLNPGFSSVARLDATFGNPIYLAVYMLFHIFIAALLLAREWTTRTSAMSLRVAYGTAAVLQLSAIFITTPIFEVSKEKGILALAVFSIIIWLYAWATTRVNISRILLLALVPFLSVILVLTGTRGGILGLVVGVMLAALLFVLFARDSKRLRQIAAGTILLIILLAGGLYLARNQPWVQSVPVLNRLASISISESTARARLMNWGMAWEGVKERPLLGWGQENYAIVFSKHYNPQMYAQEQWFDRVHNVVFDWLVAGGILGLLSYLSLFALALWYIWKRDLSGASASVTPGAANMETGSVSDAPSFTLGEKSILTGLLAAYFFQNLFVFDNIMSYVLFVSVLAYVAFRASTAHNTPQLLPQAFISARALPILATIAVLTVWGVVWFVNARPIAANQAILQGLSPQAEGLSKNLEYLEKAISYQTIGTQEAREQLMQAAAQVAGIAQAPLDIKEKFLDAAGKELLLQAESSPLDPRFPLFLGLLLNSYGAYEQAAPVLERAHKLSPDKQSILFEMASNAFGRGDTKAALGFFKEAFELAPEFSEARVMYAAVAIRTNNDALAEELLKPLIASGKAADVRIAAAYVAGKKYDKVISLWEAHIKAMPQDIQAYFTLAAAYYAGGNWEEAIAKLKKAAEIDPSVREQVEGMIKEIRSGSTPR